MASVKLYLDQRKAKKDGRFPLKASINRNNLHVYIPLDIDLYPDQFQEFGGRSGHTWVVEHSNKDFLNRYILTMLNRIEESLLNLTKTDCKDTKSFRLAISHKLNPEPTEEEETPNKPLFFDIANEYISHQGEGTKKIYNSSMLKVIEYCNHIGTNPNTLTFDDINFKWLSGFQEYFLKKGNTINTISMPLHNIRRIINLALDNEIDVPYPFRRFKIKYEPTAFRALTLEQMQTFLHFDCPQHLQLYKDMFLLTFYLIGINIKDLFYLKKKDVVNGRILYRRAKTKKNYSIKIYPEAQTIIEKYQGIGEGILNLSDHYTDYRPFAILFNYRLKDIANLIGDGFPPISTYWARYSWVNIAHRLSPGVPKDDISIALGHYLGGSQTTAIYLDTDLDKADIANRRVIDAVTKKPQP